MSNIAKMPPRASVPATSDEDTYVPIAQRWREVLAAYPPAEGWSITVEGDLSKVPLHYAGSATQAPTVRFTATLRNPTGSVVATGSTLFIVDAPRDWECGETNARHRLAMALGFHPRGMLDDENRTQGQVGEGAPAAPAQAQTAAQPIVASARRKAAARREEAPADATEPALPAESPLEAETAANEAEASTDTPASTDDPFAGIAVRDEPEPTHRDDAPPPREDPIDEACQDIGTPTASLGSLNAAIAQRAQQRGIGVDWTPITTDAAAVAWLIKHQ